ncbi:MAG: DegT/DnrJ/EryC1/StrS family aminotransferase [Candidatus Omnitrophica bacterium]|nr:DegT/DnrJ/EryC1/StrS family aminotransferase [Candidatus Omnitrophota bacterium]
MKVLAVHGGDKVRTKPFFTGGAIIGEEERRRVKEVLDSGILSGFLAQADAKFLGGKQVLEFEKILRNYFSMPYAVTVNSATAGLHVALGACGVSPGDEVIVSPYTMCASATAIVMMNGVPVFADINEHNFCFDPESVRRCITPRTKGIVVVHLFGGAADMDAIMVIAKEHNLFVVEDCAQAPGAKYKGRHVGTFGDAGVFSLNQNKTITCGEGGFVLTRDAKIALRIQLMRNHGEVVVQQMNVEDISNIVGFNYRMTELEAAVAIGQFKNLDTWNTHRRNLANYLTKQLSKFDSLECPNVPLDIEHSYFVYPIKLKVGQLGVSRDTFLKAIHAEGIPLSGGYVRPIYWEPMFQKKIAYGRQGYPFTPPVYAGSVDYSRGLCPVCERMYEQELMLTPVCRYPNTKEDMDDVVHAFDKVLSHLDELK